jgi:hypothetical protein
MASSSSTSSSRISELLKQVETAVERNHVNLLEFFKENDKDLSYSVSESEFMIGLALAVGKDAGLSSGDLSCIMKFYRSGDGRVHYKHFCDLFENGLIIYI